MSSQCSETSFNSDGFDVSIRESTGFLTISRESKKNSLSREMWQAIPAIIASLAEDSTVRSIVISGKGDTSFCAGADISEFTLVRKNADTARRYELENELAFAAIRTCSKPVIAMINGYCLGGGFGIAAACDIRIADNSAQFSVPASRLGLAYPLAAMKDIVDAVGAQNAKLMLFTARRFTAEEMQKTGFLFDAVAENELPATIAGICSDIANGAPLSIKAAKLSIRAALSSQSDDGEAASSAGSATFNSRDYAEGIAAFTQKRRPQFTGE